MATHHPYSFSDPAEPTVARRRAVHVSDERGRAAAWDSEAPATAHDWDIERKESRAPLYIAGAVSAAILGGLLVVLGAAAGEPRLYPTAVNEFAPSQAAYGEKLDAQSLDFARAAARGMATTPAVPSTPVELEVTDTAAMSPAPTGVSSMNSAMPSVDSSEENAASVEPSQSLPPELAEPIMTPAASPTAPPSAIELDSDNPYTPERERPVDAIDSPAPRTPTGADTSDNPY